MNWTATAAKADLFAQALSCSVAHPCLIDTEFGMDTPIIGPFANASVIDSVSTAGLSGYLGQAIAQARYGQIGTAAELQASAFDRFTDEGIGATGFARATDTLMFSSGRTVQFGFTLHTPTVDLCGLAIGESGPCDVKLGFAASGFGATITPQYKVLFNPTSVDFEVDDFKGAVSNEITGSWNPQTGLLLSDPVLLIDPDTGQRVPGVDVLMSSTSNAMALGFDPASVDQNTRAAALFGDTGTLTEIRVFDDNGNLIPNVTITSASGTAYPVATTGPPTAAPEPSALELILLAFGLMGSVVRCRRVRASPNQ